VQKSSGLKIGDGAAESVRIMRETMMISTRLPLFFTLSFPRVAAAGGIPHSVIRFSLRPIANPMIGAEQLKVALAPDISPSPEHRI
jgi:hypothetical protein